MNLELTRGRLALAAAALIAGIAGVSYAAIPASNGTISACKDAKGTLKVIDAEAGQGCNANQQLLSWNQQGPTGPPGPAGPVGPQGPIGPSNGYYDTVDSYTVGVNWSPVISLNVPAGSYVINASLRARNYAGYPVGVECKLGEPTLMSASLGPAGSQQLAATTALTRSGLDALAPVVLHCTGGLFGEPVELRDISMTAVRVGTLSRA